MIVLFEAELKIDNCSSLGWQHLGDVSSIFWLFNWIFKTEFQIEFKTERLYYLKQATSVIITSMKYIKVILDEIIYLIIWLIIEDWTKESNSCTIWGRQHWIPISYTEDTTYSLEHLRLN